MEVGVTGGVTETLARHGVRVSGDRPEGAGLMRGGTCHGAVGGGHRADVHGGCTCGGTVWTWEGRDGGEKTLPGGIRRISGKIL
jgi:hypothetical protein